MSTEQQSKPDLTVRAEKRLPSRWPSTHVRRVRPWRWRWWIEDETSVVEIAAGYALTGTWARTRAETARKRVAAERAEKRRAES